MPLEAVLSQHEDLKLRCSPPAERLDGDWP